MTKYKTVALNCLEGKAKDTAQKVLAPVGKVIESETAGGWSFVNMYNMPIYVKPGCIARIIGQTGGTVYFYMLVFSREA